MTEKRVKEILLLAACFWVVGFLGYDGIEGQAVRGKGRLSGRVIDKEEKPVAGADVELVWQGTPTVSFRTRTNPQGSFHLNGLANGDWEIRVRAKGYMQTRVRTHFLRLRNIPPVNIILEKLPNAVIRSQVDGCENLLETARQLFNAGIYDEARTFYQKCLEQHPGAYQLYVFIGNCYKEQAAYDRAMAQYRQVFDFLEELDPAMKADVYTAVGDLYLRQGDLKTTVVYFDRALEGNPDARLAYRLGQVFFSHNRAEESLRYFERAVAFNPGWGEPHLKMGYIYLNTGDSTRAAERFEKFLELSPQSDQAAEIKTIIKKLSKRLD